MKDFNQSVDPKVKLFSPELVGIKPNFSNILELKGLLQSESISALCHGNARGLAAMAAFMAANGTLNGK